ncbi:histidinol phosphate phosphatase [Clostridium hydrogenum]|uniref:histidinol phosphate phosphatase n=1 Tax=Clostridium hydrogenum TaxID=2855764 RepID=UPI001F23CACE|nr:histidinol phosphate phosphatase [Clostridium hydrogenum]
MIFDSHVHTEFSTDSKLKLEEALKTAGDLGIGIISTDHIDLNYPEKDKFIFDIDEYFNKYYKYRSDKYFLGVEIGMTDEFSKENRNISEKYDFDYIIGSIHFVDGIDIFDKELYKDRDKKYVYERYFQNMIECIKTHEYINSLAHIDYICRYASYKNTEINYNEYSDLIDEVLRLIVSREIAFEINLRRLSNMAAVENLIPIYKRYKEIGGSLVTIGSDSHNSESIGLNLKAAFYIAEKCKLKPVYYKNRKPEYF